MSGEHVQRKAASPPANIEGKTTSQRPIDVYICLIRQSSILVYPLNYPGGKFQEEIDLDQMQAPI
jgi:hypothetical protein